MCFQTRKHASKGQGKKIIEAFKKYLELSDFKKEFHGTNYQMQHVLNECWCPLPNSCI